MGSIVSRQLELLAAGFVEIAALAVDQDDSRKINDRQAADSLGAQFRIGDNLGLPDALGQQGAGAAGRAKVNRAVLPDGSDNSLERLPLPIITRKPCSQHPGRIGIHPAAGRRAGRTDRLAGPGRAGSGIVDSLAVPVDRQRSPASRLAIIFLWAASRAV